LREIEEWKTKYSETGSYVLRIQDLLQLVVISFAEIEQLRTRLDKYEPKQQY